MSAMPTSTKSHGTHAEVHSTNTLFLIVHAAVIPTNVLPAPHGKTIIPDLARLYDVHDPLDPRPLHPTPMTDPLPNILLNDVS